MCLWLISSTLTYTHCSVEAEQEAECMCSANEVVEQALVYNTE